MAELAAFAISTQGLSSLVAGCAAVAALPGPLSDFLLEEISHSRARAKRLQQTLGSVVSQLRAAGVEVVAMKGSALAFFHYPDPGLRPMGDLDLLLRDPGDLARATEALRRAGWRLLYDTPRHRVFAREDERVVRPASEDEGNPIRVEIHMHFRVRVLGEIYDASAALRRDAETRDVGGTPVAIAAGPALRTHLLFHAAGDFGGNGIRGIQAHDFRLLAREAGSGALAPPGDSSKVNAGRLLIDAATPPDAAAPLLYAADAVERLFPLTFEETLFERLAERVDPELRRRAARLPALRHTRPARGWTLTLATLVNGRMKRARFLLRVVFPTLGEVKANVAPDASGRALVAAWIGVFLRRIGRRLR